MFQTESLTCGYVVAISWRQPDSNRRPIDCEPIALPTELCPQWMHYTTMYVLPSNEFPSGKFGEPSPSSTLKNYRLQQVLRHWNPGLNQKLVRYCQMLWIEVWIGIGLSDFLQHTIFKFHVLGHKVKLFKAFQSSPTFFCLPAEFKSHGFCGLCRSVALCWLVP